MKGTITFSISYNHTHFDIDVDMNGTLTEPLSPKIPNRPNYRFKYWSTQSGGGGTATTYTTQQLETPGFFATTSNPTMTLHDIWERIITPP